MFLKIAGGILIISASGLMGILLSNRLSLRYKELNNLRSSMQLLETEIIYGATPLPFALINVSQKTEGLISRFFSNVSFSLMDRAYFTINDAWSHGVEVMLRESPFSRSDKELIRGFGAVLGSSDREDQKKHFGLFYIQIKQQANTAQEEIYKSARMYRSLGFLLGITIFVIFV
ncbi:MAG: hypothetical protein ACM3ZR_09895 [Pseudomonadota bacterium]